MDYSKINDLLSTKMKFKIPTKYQLNKIKNKKNHMLNKLLKILTIKIHLIIVILKK